MEEVGRVNLAEPLLSSHALRPTIKPVARAHTQLLSVLARALEVGRVGEISAEWHSPVDSVRRIHSRNGCSRKTSLLIRTMCCVTNIVVWYKPLLVLNNTMSYIWFLSVFHIFVQSGALSVSTTNRVRVGLATLSLSYTWT